MPALKDNDWNNVLISKENHELRISMIIENFLDIVSLPGERLPCPMMQCTKQCGIKWLLQVEPFGQSDKEQDAIGIYLKLVKKPENYEVVKAVMELSIMAESTNINTSTLHIPKDKLAISYGFPCFIKRSTIEEEKEVYLPKGHLTIQCVGKVFHNKPTVILHIAAIPKRVELTTVNLLRALYEEGLCYDVLLKSSDREFKCHKAVLAASSSYFRDMFQSDMTENRENVVDVTKEMYAEELQSFLEYVYLKKSDFSLNLASTRNMYRIANLYDMVNLEELCEDQLIDQVELGNATDLFSFAVEYGADELKKASATIIAISE